jgi:hypothetical protein
METNINIFTITYRISKRGFKELELYNNQKIGIFNKELSIINKKKYNIKKKNNVLQHTVTFVISSNQSQCEIITKNIPYSLGNNNTHANMILEGQEYHIEREPNSWLSDSKGIIKLYFNQELRAELIETKRNYIFSFLSDEGVISFKPNQNSSPTYINELIILTLLICKNALRPNTMI